MKPPRPLPDEPPFISFYTPTFRRPASLAKCMQSLDRQTLVERLEQIVVPDHVGHGVVGGLFGRIPWYASALRGEYVHVLADDDYLPDERAVEKLMSFARKTGNPEVIVVGSVKNGFEYPSCNPTGEPQVTQVDMGCYVMRRDVWLAHCLDYGSRYEGDFDHALAMYRAGRKFEFFDFDFVEGAASNGRPEW